MSVTQTQFNQAAHLHQQGQYAHAKAMCESILTTEPNHAQALHLLGVIEYQTNNHQQAVALIGRAINANPTNAVFYASLGNAHQALLQFETAIEHYERAISINPTLAEVHFNRGNALQALGRFAAAVDSYARALALRPDVAEIYFNRALALQGLNNLTAAVEDYAHAINIKPDYAEAYLNRGLAYAELMQGEAAVQSYDGALSINPDFAEAYFCRGNALYMLKQYKAAVESYACAVAIKSDFIEAYVNRGNALQALSELDKAMDDYDHAIAINPTCVDAYVNRGNVHRARAQPEAALYDYDTAITIAPTCIDAHINRATALQDLRQFEAAVVSYNHALTLNPDAHYVLGTLLHTKMKLGDWTHFAEDRLTLIEKIKRGQKCSPNFPLLSITDSLAVQKKAADIIAQDKHVLDAAVGALPKYKRAEKIRIGYFSADFWFHPVSILLAELFELHDKNRFELVAFSFGPDIKDAMRLRVENAFDEFIDVRHQSDQAIALLARQKGIDIAVDLGGDTAHARVGIFAYRAAPIQVGYIGYLGTMGADYIDYLIADKTLIPQEAQQYYSEKIVYLPSYQVNDSKRVISEKNFTKQALGLPETGFVFCCFNHNYKITPDTFDGWMRLLTAVQDSVLFLYADNKAVEQNLKKEAQSRGVNPDRVIFGERLPPDEYLARYKVADLFLDTFPYNAGATASDALWVGLPVLTLSGETFASRVAASLLTAIGLPELITHTQEDYEALAIELATHPERLRALKEKLAANKLTTPLFNTPLFARNIEKAYTQMVNLYQSDIKPCHIEVG